MEKSTQSRMVESLIESDFVDFAKLSVLSAGVIVFFSLIGLDTWKALKKGAHWIPGDALVVSALTIQLMNLLNGQIDFTQTNEVSGCIKYDRLSEEVLISRDMFISLNKFNFVMIHISRVMLCVLMAYLLPGMVRPGSTESWGKLAALGLSVMLHICSVFFNVQSRYYGVLLVFPTFGLWSVVIISISLVWLILLLSSATMARKGIRDIISQKIPIVLAQRSNGVDNSWQAVEDQVLKSWIVARACYPESIIARSVLSSSAALAVTICIVSSVVGCFRTEWIIPDPDTEFWFKFTITILEVVFILIGWAIICWRWVSSVAYCGRWGRKKSWRKYFRVEDFWTRHIVELQEAESSPIDETIRKMEIKLTSMEEITIYLPRILLRWLYRLQFTVVFFSKGCWFLSELMFRNRVIRRLLSKHRDRVDRSMSDYKTILENVHFLWETPHSVLATNRKSIIKARRLLRDGNEEGKSCDALVVFLTDKKSTGCVGKRCLDPQAGCQTGLKFLCKRDHSPKLEVEEHFLYASKKSWKLTAISLVNIIVRLSPGCGRDCLEAYSQAWQVMDVVDEYDQGTDSLLSKAADRVFKTLKSDNGPDSKRSTATTTMQGAVKAIAKLAEENEKIAEVTRGGRDSLDWKKVAAANALYKLCKSIDCTDSDDLSALIDELQTALADIIASCIEKVGAALVENCSKWAQDLDERKLVQALYLAGKSRGLMEKLGCSPNGHILPFTENDR